MPWVASVISPVLPSRRGACVCSGRAGPGQAVAHQFGARGDAELGEDLTQVIVDGAWTEVQLRSDLAVGQAVGDQPGNLELLRCQPLNRGQVALAGGFAGCSQLGFGPPGP